MKDAVQGFNALHLFLGLVLVRTIFRLTIQLKVLRYDLDHIIFLFRVSRGVLFPLFVLIGARGLKVRLQ